MSPITFDHGYALLIGVGAITAYPAWSLPVTVKDALALKQLLTDPDACAYPADESHVRVLHDDTATRERISQGLTWLGDRAKADTDATIVVFYSGHGFHDQVTGRYYLIQHDVNPFDIPGSAIDAEAFTDGLRAIAARRLLVILDCCHAQGMATSKDAPSIKTPANLVSQAPPEPIAKAMRANLLSQGSGRAVFLSSLGTEESWIRRDQTMSIYTYHLLEALHGANSRPGETEVRITNVANYVSKAVPETAKREYQATQTPFFDWAAEDFPVALLLGGKGLPQAGWNAVQGEASERIDTITRSVSVVARGDRAVAIGGTVTNSPIVTGDGNTVQQAHGRNVAQSGSGNAVGDHE